MKITGIILAGGLSSRMGKDKSFIQLDEHKMIEKIIALIRPFCDELLISANKNKYKDFGYEIIKDKHKRIGPLGGIISCLNESSHELNIIISCDTPNISGKTILKLLQESKNYDITLPCYNNRCEPLIAVYNRNCVEKLELMANSSSYKLQTIINNLNSNIIHFEESDKVEEFININSKKDLKKYLNLKNNTLKNEYY
ncbi:MAG TPA: molybdenum cofactor guanylyltransferase [Flavobacteriales bacterium]|jgi:molybdopterin-guanine dinucleotide biosynthesis protein A|nr:molybdenum cofactor guanylyltransferase [Flavobacteriales bacterium]|tara:strand:- start:1000 stop:1593 length:594 start_codon:yes stop_codon:yes gene_type:complete